MYHLVPSLRLWLLPAWYPMLLWQLPSLRLWLLPSLRLYQAWYPVSTVATKPTAARSYQAYSHRVMYGCTQYAYGCYLVARTSTSSTIARVLPQYICMQHVYTSFLHGHVVNLPTHGTILVPPCNIVTTQLKYQ